MISLVVLYVGLAVLAPLMAVLQRLWPAPEERPEVWSRARRLDWAYWLFTPWVTGTLAPVRFRGPL